MAIVELSSGQVFEATSVKAVSELRTFLTPDQDPDPASPLEESGCFTIYGVGFSVELSGPLEQAKKIRQEAIDKLLRHAQ